MSDINDIKESISKIQTDIDWIKKSIQDYEDKFTPKQQHTDLSIRVDKVEHNLWWLLISFVVAVGGIMIYIIEKGIKI